MMRKWTFVVCGVLILAVPGWFVVHLIDVHGTQSARAAQACSPTPAAGATTKRTPTPSRTIAPGAVSNVTPFPRQNVPSRTTDLAPQLATDDKETIVIRHADCSLEAVLVAPDQASAYIRSLPAGDAVATIFSPQSVMGQHPQPGSTQRGTSPLPTPLSASPPPPPSPPRPLKP